MPSKRVTKNHVLGATIIVLGLTIIYVSLAPLWTAKFHQKAIHKIVHVNKSVPIYELAGTNAKNYHLEQVNAEMSGCYKGIDLKASARMSFRSKDRTDVYYLVSGPSGTEIGYVAVNSVKAGPTKYHLPSEQIISFANVTLPWKINPVSGTEPQFGVAAWRGNGSNTNGRMTYYLGNPREDVGFAEIRSLNVGAPVTTVDSHGVKKKYRVYRVIDMNGDWRNLETNADEWLYMENHLQEQIIALQTSLDETGTTSRVVFAK